MDPVVVNLHNDEEIVEPEIFGEKIKYTVKEVRDLYYEYVDTMNFFQYLDNELFSLTYTDFQEMPAITMEVFQMYKTELKKLIAEINKKG